MIEDDGYETVVPDLSGVKGEGICTSFASHRTASQAELIEALEAIQHSIKQAQKPGNDWRRELSLIENISVDAIAKVKGEV